MISLVIPTHQRHTSLLRLINSIKQQKKRPDQLIIISNLKDSFLVGASFQQAIQGLKAQVVCVGKVGVNGARNLGLQKASEEIVLYVDDDCELKDPHFLLRLCELHEQNPCALAIGGTYAVAKEACAIDKAYNILARAWLAPEFKGENKSWRLLGGNLSFKRVDLLATKQIFNENIFFGGTESELLGRLQKRGELGLFYNSLEIYHHTQLDEKKIVSKAFHQSLTHFDCYIDGGFEQNYYHKNKTLWAQALSRGEEEFRAILYYMELYNQAFHLAQNHKNLKKVYRMSRQKACKTLGMRKENHWLW